MTFITRMRPSNFVLFAALPFIIYLFVAVPNYRRSLVAIVGVEENAGRYFTDFLLLTLVLGLGLLLAFTIWRDWMSRPIWRMAAIGAAIASVLLAAGLALFGDVSLLAGSILANLVDPQASDLVVKAVTPRRLTPEGQLVAAQWMNRGLWIYAAGAAVLTALSLLDLKAPGSVAAARIARRLLFTVNALLLGFLLLAAHLGFASGLFTTLRAGIFAYVLACLLGLLWASLLRLAPGKRTFRRFAIASGLLLAGSAALFVQPHETWVLVGSLDKSTAIVRGTPKSEVDFIRFRGFEAAPAGELTLRSTVSPEHALKLMADGSEVSSAFIPEAMIPAGAPQIWRASFLPDAYQSPAIALLVAGALAALLTFSGFQHNRHPLSVGAEFFIDTVRGIPMLVIILFIGLPLSGALKDASSGTIDLPNVARGVVAIAVGYSAYLAEIFRAGIEAVPRGQIEAARTLGLSSWQLARLIVFPQALRVIIPPLGNEFIAMLKDTSLLSILSVRDITQRMREFQSASFLPFAPFNSAAILYVCLTLAAASLISFIERKYHVKAR